MKTVLIVVLFFLLVFLTICSYVLKNKIKNGHKKCIWIILVSVISVSLAILTPFTVKLLTSEDLSIGVDNLPHATSKKYNFDEFIIGITQPSFEDLVVCEEYFIKYINETPKIKALSDEKLKENKEVLALICKREQADELEKQLDISEEIFNIVSNNASVTNIYAVLKQENAIKLYTDKNYANEDMFLQAIEINFHLLSLTDLTINKSDIYYRIGQCFEYLSLSIDERSERNHYQDSLTAIVFFKLAYESIDYEKSINYGCPYAMSGIISHRIAQNQEYDLQWSKFANAEYEIALSQLHPNSIFVTTCTNGKKELDALLSSISQTR